MSIFTFILKKTKQYFLIFKKQCYQLLIAIRLYYLVVVAAFDIPVLFQ